MLGVFGKSPKKKKEGDQRRAWMGLNFSAENFIPGVIIGFIFGLFLDLTKLPRSNSRVKRLPSPMPSKNKHHKYQPSTTTTTTGSDEEELKMVLVVRQDLKMGPGKVASQCAHAATGMYAELLHSQRSLLGQWEYCGQAKIVVTCKNQQEMNKLKHMAESIGLPTFVVADAGRTQVSAGSKTVLAIGPGRKSSVDSVTGKLRLL